jgi:hypothetical protein
VTTLWDYQAEQQARNTDPITSKIAAARLKPGAAKHRILRTYRNGPLTDEQAADLAGFDLYQTGKRCSDLRRDGLIEQIGIRDGRSGTPRMVCALTERGREVISDASLVG